MRRSLPVWISGRCRMAPSEMAPAFSFSKLSFRYPTGLESVEYPDPDGYAHIETDETLDVTYFSGSVIGDRFPRTTVTFRSRPKLPDCIAVGSLDLVSENLRDLLVEEGVEAEF